MSVLVTVFDREAYVADAIRSVLRQTFTDFELIVVDDASSDRSRDVIAEFADDERVRVVHNARNLGQFPTRNRALRLARGRYVKYLDSDDALLPTCLETMVCVLERFPDSALLLWSTTEPGCWPREVQPREYLQRGLLCGARFERAPLSVLFRRDVLLESGAFDEGRPLTADFEVIVRIASRHPVVLGPPGLLFYRRHPGQVIATDAFARASFLTPFAVLAGVIKRADCPLDSAEARDARARLLRGALRPVLGRALGCGDVSWGIEVLRALRPSPADIVRAAFFGQPRDERVVHWGTAFAEGVLGGGTESGSASGLSSVLLLAGEPSATLDGVRAALALPTAPEVVVCARTSEVDRLPDVRALSPARVRVATASIGATTDDMWLRGAAVATGRFVAFADTARCALHPHVFGIALGAIAGYDGQEVLSSGPLAGFVGCLRLSADEATALDLATSGAVVGADETCLLVRRSALLREAAAARTNQERRVLAIVSVLVTQAGAILGPEALSTSAVTAARGAGSSISGGGAVARLGPAPPEGWEARLRAEAPRCLARVAARCGEHDVAWLVPRLLGSSVTVDA